MVRAPVERSGQAGAAVELCLVAPGRVPFGRRPSDVTAQPATFGVLLDTIVVRSVLVTALNLDLGPRIWWPSRYSRQPDVPAAEAARPADSSGGQR